MKVVVVAAVGAFVAGVLAREMHFRDEALLEKGLHRAVDGREAQGVELAARDLEYLEGREGATRLVDGSADDVALLGLTLRGLALWGRTLGRRRFLCGWHNLIVTTGGPASSLGVAVIL